MATTRTEPADTGAGPGPEGPAHDGDTDGGAAFDSGHRTYQRLSLRGPALIVLGIAVVILVGGVVASALATSGSSALPFHSVTLPDGTEVALTPATAALKPVITSEPPADILGSLAVPAGSTRGAFVDTDQNQTQYDRSVTFTSGLSSDQLVSFFQTLLPKLGWKVTASAPATGATAGATEVLATKGSNDGFYWEVGAVVDPGSSTGLTSFTVHLYELPDQD
jgi:hypothetical protein